MVDEEKKIIVFPGSISELEKMTGKEYVYILDEESRVVIVGTDFETRLQGGVIGNAQTQLQDKARNSGADALVHASYSLTRVNTWYAGRCAEALYVGHGYAVKQKKVKTI